MQNKTQKTLIFRKKSAFFSFVFYNIDNNAIRL